MPIYEYTCRKCNAHIEIMQKISDKPPVRHAKCGGRLEKEWSRTGFQFKGTGWYVTDYAGKKAEKKEEKDSKETKDATDTTKDAAAAPAKSETPTETPKPEAKKSKSDKDTASPKTA